MIDALLVWSIPMRERFPCQNRKAFQEFFKRISVTETSTANDNVFSQVQVADLMLNSEKLVSWMKPQINGLPARVPVLGSLGLIWLDTAHVTWNTRHEC